MARESRSPLRAVLVLGCTLVSPAALFAQGGQPPAGRPKYGVEAGANFANLGGSDVQNSKIRTGLVAGVYAAWPMSNGFSFQPSLLYSMEGAKESDSQTESTLKLGYVRLPLLVRYTWPVQGTTQPFLAVGPSFGYQTSCQISGSGNGVSVSASCDSFTEPGGSQRKKFDVSGRIEAGLDFAMSGRTLTLGGSYSYGFTDVAKYSNARNRVFSVFLGIGL